MKRVLVFGANGLLGSKLIDDFVKNNFEVYGTTREHYLEKRMGVTPITFSVGDSLEKILGFVKPELVVNCIVDKTNQFAGLPTFKNMYMINSEFPRKLSRACSDFGSFLFQISTDAVFRGNRSFYYEFDFRFPKTFYGWTKRWGEVTSDSSLILRLSMVANELNDKSEVNHLSKSIYSAKENMQFVANTSPSWNGVTVSKASELLVKLAIGEVKPVGIRHFYTSEKLSRFDLITALKTHFNRPDIEIFPSNHKENRSALKSIYMDDVIYFWDLLGYKTIPRFEDILKHNSNSRWS